MEKKIKVLFLSRWYPHRNDPMYGLFVQRHAEAVCLYCDVSVINVQENEKQGSVKFETEQFTLNGVYTINIYYRKWNNIILGRTLNIIRNFKAHLRGWKIIEQQQLKPDIIHANILTRTGVIALYFKIFKKIPYIITEHWSRYLNNSLSYKGFFRKLFTRMVVKRAAAITTVTTNLMEAMIKHKLKNNNYYVIPNVVDVDMFLPAKNKIQQAKKSIIHLSCFEDVSKNISGIIRSAKKLSLSRQDFEIRLVGDGIDRHKLEKFAEEEGIKDRFVFFDGLMEGPKLIEKINSADFMILFSHYENLPVVILEAFACGLPVLSSDVGGIAEHLNKERGLLTAAGDENTFVEKLNEMLSDYTKYDAEKIREYAVNNFSNKVIGDSFEQIYSRILAGRKLSVENSL